MLSDGGVNEYSDVFLWLSCPSARLSGHPDKLVRTATGQPCIKVLLQEKDSSSAHYALAVGSYLSAIFWQCWNGRGSPVLSDPLDNPPRRLDMSPCYNSLWGLIKETPAQKPYHTTQDVEQTVRLASIRVTPHIFPKMSHRTQRGIILCHENGGAQTELLDT